MEVLILGVNRTLHVAWKGLLIKDNHTMYIPVTFYCVLNNAYILHLAVCGQELRLPSLETLLSLRVGGS